MKEENLPYKVVLARTESREEFLREAKETASEMKEGTPFAFFMPEKPKEISLRSSYKGYYQLFLNSLMENWETGGIIKLELEEDVVKQLRKQPAQTIEEIIVSGCFVAAFEEIKQYVKLKDILRRPRYLGMTLLEKIFEKKTTRSQREKFAPMLRSILSKAELKDIKRTKEISKKIKCRSLKGELLTAEEKILIKKTKSIEI